MNGNELRQCYLAFFEQRGHKKLASDSLIPSNDPSLLFTGAGMNQFKDMFLGTGTLPYKRVTTVQKCLRVPDLENVGLTPRHHTFFEMLGNFSFGDYFKKECIPWEWEFFTQECGIPAKNLVVSIYTDDEEAFAIWHKIVGLPKEKIFRFGEKENFWPAQAPSKGPNGPCGPCSEIYFDARPWEPLPKNKGLTSMPEGRFLEIGNCVFTQFDRQSDGALLPLPQKNIDVGLGLERIAAVLVGLEQGVGLQPQASQEIPGNFATDLFQPYILALSKRSKKNYHATGNEPASIRMRRIADHVRAATFCIADGAVPSNEERGYVVRKIIRRACRDLYNLGIEKPYLHELSDLVKQIMGQAYPEVKEHHKLISSTLLTEEERFREIYQRGISKLEEMLAHKPKVLSGEQIFELHDTYGFPIDITRDICAEHHIQIDEKKFEQLMQQQRERARSGSALRGDIFDTGPIGKIKSQRLPQTKFMGYETSLAKAKILDIVEKEQLVQKAEKNAELQIVLEQTPFYAESGGQVGDRGELHTSSAVFQVTDTQNIDGYYFHAGKLLKGSLAVGEALEAKVDLGHRWKVTKNHTATHLLHKALRVVLGDHVLQRGSLVHPDYLRFDFTHNEKLSAVQIQTIEDLVNQKIMEAIPVQPVVKSLQAAKQEGAMALFGEKYGDAVRVLTIGDFSKELCGGTHVENTGNIGLFRITKEQSLAAGIRRIVALTGPGALQSVREQQQIVHASSQLLKAPPEQLVERIQALQKELKELKQKKVSSAQISLQEIVEELNKKAQHRDKAKAWVLCEQVKDLSVEQLRALCDKLIKDKAEYVIGLFSVTASGIPIVITASSLFTQNGFHAGNIAREAGRRLGGGGGGKAELGQGQGKVADKINDAIQFVQAKITEILLQAGVQS